jgi:hypothetical protein
MATIYTRFDTRAFWQGIALKYCQAKIIWGCLMSFRIAVFRGFFACFILLAGGNAFAVNPNLTYFANGDTPDGWFWVVQDPTNYWSQLEGNQGASAGGKVTIGPSDAPEFPKAIKAVWDKGPAPDKNWGGLTITGRTVDLSAYEHTGELMLVVRVDAKPKKDVKLKMQCLAEKEGDKCEAEVFIASHLKKATPQQWFALPIPLDCFVEQGGANFNLKKIKTPVEIGTDSKMVIHIAEISIQKMAPGEEGCTSHTPAAPQGDGGTK